LSALNKFGS